MRRILRHRPGPAMIVALLALVVATAGTAGAASYLITSTKQISPKVRKALKGKRGKKGAPGAQGVAGAKGDKGDPGATGARGPSDAFSVYREGISPPPLAANTTNTVATLPLPAGKFVLTAFADMDDISGSAKFVDCVISGGGTSSEVTIRLSGSSSSEHCSLNHVITMASPGNATLAIKTPASAVVRGGDVRLTAIQVENLTETAVSG